MKIATKFLAVVSAYEDENGVLWLSFGERRIWLSLGRSPSVVEALRALRYIANAVNGPTSEVELLPTPSAAFVERKPRG